MTHATEIIMLPRTGIVFARCSCGWAGGQKKIADFELAVSDETDHNADVLYELLYGRDEEQ